MHASEHFPKLSPLIKRHSHKTYIDSIAIFLKNFPHQFTENSAVVSLFGCKTKQSFYYSAAKIYNDLSIEIRREGDYDVFLKLLKDFYVILTISERII